VAGLAAPHPIAPIALPGDAAVTTAAVAVPLRIAGRRAAFLLTPLLVALLLQ
jgi:hypothetical protein